MRASIVIATRNEGDRLWKTVRSCADSTADLECEIVVADDASDDGSVHELHRRFPDVHVVGYRDRVGAQATKDLAARRARGEVLVFLDAHCNPEDGAIARLVTDVEQLESPAVVAPRVAPLDSQQWRNSETTFGNGYALELETFEERWTLLPTLRRRGRFFESPNLVGCCAALSRELYENLGGFDRGMRGWGSEGQDFGLKVWLMGYRVLNDIEPVIGHWFRPEEECDVPKPQIVANQLRMARKHFGDSVWNDWLQRFRIQQPPEVWKGAWDIFLRGRESVERERECLMARRVRDEFWYADEFDMDWPLCLLNGSSLSQSTGIGNEGRPGEALAVDSQDWWQGRPVDRSGPDYGRRLWLEHLQRPRNYRAPIPADAVGVARSDDGAWLTLFLKIGQRPWGDLDVEQAAFQCLGGEDVFACGSLLVRMIEGRTLENICRFEANDLLRRFGAGPQATNGAALAINALRDALESLKIACKVCPHYQTCQAWRKTQRIPASECLTAQPATTE